MKTARCPECAEQFPAGRRGGGHCRGGSYGGCCRTFVSDVAFDKHRTGPFSDRSCIDVALAPGWTRTDDGWRHPQIPRGTSSAATQTDEQVDSIVVDTPTTPEPSTTRRGDAA